MQDAQNIQFEEDGFLIKGVFRKKKKQEEIAISYQKGERKKVSRNKIDYERLSEHIGLVPVVIISPYDTDLINQGSEERRKFIDSIISQFDAEYLNDLIQYNRALAQRNALLKQMAGTRFMPEALELWDHQLIQYGDRIFEKRDRFIRQFLPVFQGDFNMISRQIEKVNIDYRSHLIGSDMQEQLEAGLAKDMQSQYTTRGIHRDDLDFTIMDKPIRRFGSQGQQKSMLLALRTAQLGYIRRETGITPILLLDDVFDKLDNSRIRNLMDLVSDNEEFGQVFITDTDGERMKKLFSESNMEVKMFAVDQGKVKEEGQS